MKTFLPMLEEYLKSIILSPSSIKSYWTVSDVGREDSEYVYDVFIEETQEGSGELPINAVPLYACAISWVDSELL